jgi:glycosyltransferase involved in cell wall biosynthesis
MKVSVIIPTYNRGELLIKAIGSVLDQTYKDFEIIVVDDGSIDDTKMRLAPSISTKHVQYYSQSNGGPSKARNLGIEKAKGEYIAFLDSDDLWLPQKLEAQLEYINKRPFIKAVHSNLAIIKDGKFDGSDFKSKGLLKNGWLFEDYLLLKGWILLSTLLIHRTVIEKVGVFNESLRTAEDTNFILRIAKDYEFGYVDNVLVHRQVHESNLSIINTENPGTFINLEDIRKRYPEVAKGKRSLIEKAYEKRYSFVAKSFFYQKEYGLARVNYFKVLKYNHLQIMAMAYIVLTFFPKPVIEFFRNIRRLILNRNNS